MVTNRCNIINKQVIDFIKNHCDGALYQNEGVFIANDRKDIYPFICYIGGVLYFTIVQIISNG